MGRSGPIEPPGEPLTDGAVAVRLRRESDLAAIAAASHDPESLRWLTDPPMDAEARRTSLDRNAEAWRTGQAAPMVIAAADSDEPIGIVNLQFRDDEVATIAYSVFPAHRGQGIAPRAVELVSGWALGQLRLSRLILEADEGNAASIRVAEKCGFERTGSRVEDSGATTVIFARTAS
ncbi:RimJ/RimL family protein N-acetyltransferase [Kribbella voronezhensis]|uniref:RimJ/RimL family protein N-acetyltransferase n=1 Tax=Kribbella voronezhensis TaxID=2512212 RepID=A0A4R7T837_9ACTN|nr:GNAT family N-acetyltransferase [Kribbella voronezhensis]TDU88102.1 RimJ/RimL family protein N-acetyltransferase [Kribbella voronezhensis]